MLKFNGINGQTTETFGTVKGSLITSDGNLEHTFHLVDSSVSLRFDGLLGDDFLSKYGASLSYHDQTLILNSPDQNIPSKTPATACIGVINTNLSSKNSTVQSAPIKINNSIHQSTQSVSTELLKSIRQSTATDKINRFTQSGSTEVIKSIRQSTATDKINLSTQSGSTEVIKSLRQSIATDEIPQSAQSVSTELPILINQPR